MLASPPPGFQSPSTNKQTLGGLATPGSQFKAATPGASMLNPSGFTQNSSFSLPSSQPSTYGQPPSVNPYLNSGNGNLSTLLRVLVGKTT